MDTLVLVGNDKIGRRLIRRIDANPDVRIAVDASFSLQRVLRLLWRRALGLRQLLQMYRAEIQRADEPLRRAYPEVGSNEDLLAMIQIERPRRVLLFRAGLIIRRSVIQAGPDILNVHCARLPDYAGLGSIGRALADGAHDQCATMHRVTTTIDGGEVVATVPYRLDPVRSYRQNEDIAYEAGIELVVRALSAESSAAA